MAKLIGYGSQFEYSVDDGTTWVSLGGIIDGFEGPSTSYDEAETTILSDKYRTFQPVQIDPGSASFTTLYDPTSTETQGLVDAYEAGDVIDFKVIFPDDASTEETFQGFLKSFERSVVKDSLIQATLEIRVSGDAGFTGS